MSYQSTAYLFLKALYNEHLLIKTDTGRMDYDKIREVLSIDEPDGVLDLIVAYLSGKNLLHISYPSSNLRYKTFYISEHGIKCLNQFECSKVFMKANMVLDKVVYSSGFNVRDSSTTLTDEVLSEELCQEFFLNL